MKRSGPWRSRRVTLALAVTGAIGCLACQGDPVSPGADHDIHVGETAISLRAGDTITLSAKSPGPTGMTREWPGPAGVDWVSLDPGMVTVGPDALFEAVAAGVARVRVMVDGKRDTATIRVYDGEVPALAAVMIAPDGAFTCALDPAGQASCWGENWWGQLAAPARPYTGTASPSPVQEKRFTDIGTGGAGRFACGLATDGSVWCWGINESDELGNGNGGPMKYSDRPVRVPVPEAVDWIDVGSSACAVGASGTTYCWGRQIAGPTPTVLGIDFMPRGLSVGASHACVRDGDGVVYCWGSNQYGQLGDGSYLSAPMSRPVPVRLPEPATEVSAGYIHSCAVGASGQAYCWGNNWDGRLGDGSEIHSPIPRTVPMSDPVAHISAGGVHTCALSTDGRAYCWGDNQRGQLGQDFDYGVAPGPYRALTPREVATTLRFDQIETGAEHTCAIAGYAPYCWGLNSHGQLGIGTVRPHPGTSVPLALTPMPVVAVHDGG